MLFAIGQRVKEPRTPFHVVGIRGKGFPIQIARLLRLLEIKVCRGRRRFGICRHRCGACRHRLIQRNRVVHSIAEAQRANAVERKLALGRG